MPDFISSFFIWFGIPDGYEHVLLLGLILAWAAILALRIFLCVLYRIELELARKAMKKGFADRAGAEKSKSAFVKRAAADYADLGERGIARINAPELCRKSAQRFKFLYWSFESIGRFLAVVEPAFFPAGILLVVLSNDRQVFAGFTLVLFALGKLVSSFFDYKAAKEELLSETAFTLDKELGKLYVTDAPAAINNLRLELKNIMTYQAKYLSDSIGELKEKLASVSEKTLGDTAAAVEKTLTSVSAGAETVMEPLKEWRAAIGDSKGAHEELNLSLVKMSGAVDGFRDRLSELDRLVEGYKAEFLENNRNVERGLERLSSLTEMVLELCKNSSAQTASVEASLDFVRRGQGLLETSMNQYEIALKDITSSVGTGLGKILEFHAQTAYKSLTDSAVESLRQAGSNNEEIMTKLTGALEGIIELSRHETTLIMNLKEQMIALERKFESGANPSEEGSQ